MNPSLRSKLREESAGGRRDGWPRSPNGTAHRCWCCEPHLVARRYRQLAAQAAPDSGLHYAVKASPHPVVLSTIAICGGGFDVATSAEVALLQRARPADGPLHPHQSDQEARRHRRRPTRRASARSSSRTLSRHRNSRDCRPTSRCWCGWRSAIRPRSRTCRSKFGVEPADAELLVKHVIAAGVQFAGFSFHVGSQGTSAAAVRHGAARHAGPRSRTSPRRLGVHSRVIDIGGGFPVAYREPMPTIDAIADVIDEALGDRRVTNSRCSPSRAGSWPRTV